MVPLFLLMVPFIQIGASFYLSFATPLLLIVLRLIRGLLIPRSVGHVVARIFLIAGMLASVADRASSHGVDDLLRIAREGLFLFLLTTFLERVKLGTKIRFKRAYLLYGIILAVFFALIAIAQGILFPRGIYVGFPGVVYAQNAGTVPDARVAFLDNPRPNGTFGEPSYFAFVLISLLLIFLPLFLRNARAVIVCGSLIVAGVITSSVSFLLSLTAMALYTVSRARTTRTRLLLGLGMLVFGAIFAVFASQRINDRIARGVNGKGDRSSYVRIVAPAQILLPFAFEHPLGVTFKNLPLALQKAAGEKGVGGDEILDNAAFNLIFSYGIFGAFAILYVISLSDGVLMAIYLSACFTFNGAFFSIDKFAIMTFCIVMHHAAKQSGSLNVWQLRSRVHRPGVRRAPRPNAGLTGNLRYNEYVQGHKGE